MDATEREQLKAELRQELLAEFCGKKPQKKKAVSQYGSRALQMAQEKLGVDRHAAYIISTGLCAIIRNAFCVTTVMGLTPRQEEEALEMSADIIEMMKIKRERYAKKG